MSHQNGAWWHIIGYFLTGGNGISGGDICVARACTDARHTNDTRAFPQTTLFVVSKSRLIASSARHLLVSAEVKRSPPFRFPPFKSARHNWGESNQPLRNTEPLKSLGASPPPPPKKQGFFSPAEALKSREKKWNHSKNEEFGSDWAWGKNKEWSNKNKALSSTGPQAWKWTKTFHRIWLK